MGLKLQQGQTWKKENDFIRIVRLWRLEVEYKTFQDKITRQGTHHHSTKKEFCRLIKGATLVPDKEELPPAPETSVPDLS